jgi:glycosyltransferase involved in cell wall biosynthesis
MKVAHISSTDLRGGAGRAAYGLHRDLSSIGIESKMLVRNKYSKDPDVFESSKEPKFYAKIRKLLNKLYINQHRTPEWNTLFTIPWPGNDVSNHEILNKADIIHLHWIWEFQSVVTISKLFKLGKPIVWTFHDQRAMTGGCHFTSNCTRYQTVCYDCPQLINNQFDVSHAIMKDQIDQWPAELCTIICPSNWMAACARSSRLWKKSRIETVPYSVNTETYKPFDKIGCKTKLGLKTESKYILFGAHQGNEIRKGYHLLIEALEICHKDEWFINEISKEKIIFLCFGIPNSEITSRFKFIKSLGYISDESELAVAYNACDFFILPSIEDNLPNTVLESLSCGTPVIAFETGGVSDMVIDGETGWLASKGDSNQLAKKILDAAHGDVDSSSQRKACRSHIERKFSNINQASKLRSIYEDLMKNKNIIFNNIKNREPFEDINLDPGKHTGDVLLKIFRIIAHMNISAINKIESRSCAKFCCALKRNLNGTNYPFDHNQFISLLKNANQKSNELIFSVIFRFRSLLSKFIY